MCVCGFKCVKLFESVGSVVPNERTDSREDVEDGVRHGHERSFSGVDEEQHLRKGSRAREMEVPGGRSGRSARRSLDFFDEVRCEPRYVGSQERAWRVM